MTATQARLPTVDRIPVPKEEWLSPEYAFLPAYLVVHAGDELIQFGAYEYHELPSVYMHTKKMRHYVDEICNGGHEQFFSNTAQDELAVANVLDALQWFESQNLREIFVRACDYASSSVTTYEAIVERSGFNHSEYGALDDFLSKLDFEIYRLNRDDELYHRITKRLRRCPEIYAVDGAEWPFHMRDIMEANPLRVDRLKRFSEAPIDYVEYKRKKLAV